jgi:hypothetical protein
MTILGFAPKKLSNWKGVEKSPAMKKLLQLYWGLNVRAKNQTNEPDSRIRSVRLITPLAWTPQVASLGSRCGQSLRWLKFVIVFYNRKFQEIILIWERQLLSIFFIPSPAGIAVRCYITLATGRVVGNIRRNKERLYYALH